MGRPIVSTARERATGRDLWPRQAPVVRAWRLVAIVVAALSLPVAVTPEAQPAKPHFRTGVQLVYVEVAVSDGEGRPVRGLAASEFEILEDGKRVGIEFFRSHEPVLDDPAAPAPPNSPEPIAVSQRNTALRGGRVLAIVLDGSQIGFRPRLAARTRDIAAALVDGLDLGDYAALITLGGGAHQQSDFTNDKAQLKAALRAFRPTAASFAAPATAADEFERYTRARGLLTAIGKVVDVLATIGNRRKGLVLVSEGIPFSTVEPQAREGPFNAELRRLLAEVVSDARDANVSLHAFHPGEMRSPPTPGQRSLEWLSENTGGIASVNSNVFQPGIRRVLEDTGTYYVLGYYSLAPRDGGFHRIEVRVRDSGLRVRARRGFVSHRNGMGTSVDAAIRAPLPITDIPIGLVAVPVPRAGDPASGIALGVEIPGRDLEQASGAEVLAVALDMRGEIRARSGLTIDSSQLCDPACGARIRLTRMLPLKPGRYALRIAVRRTPDGAVGTVFRQIDIPSFGKDFAVSALGLAARSTPEREQERDGRPLWAHVLIPSDKVSAAEEVDAVMKVIVSGSGVHRRSTVGFVTTLTDCAGRPEVLDRVAVKAVDFAEPSGGVYRVSLPRLSPGTYVVSTTVELPNGETQLRRLRLVVD